MGDEEDESAGPLSTSRKTFWRSASWSSSRTSVQDHASDCGSEGISSVNGHYQRCPPPPLTPRSQSHKARSCLPPLQPLAITRRSLEEWPKAGSDDLGEWPQPPTPSAKADLIKPGQGLKLDLSSLRSQVMRDQIAFYGKECSKVADHIYLGGDYVARNREILHQHGITHVLNCVGFVCPEYFKSDLVYKTLWLQDSPTEDITSILYDVFDYFEDVRQQGGRVFVHCCHGVSRSTSLVIAYLMWTKGQSFDDAFQFVKAARGIANPNMGFACQLLQCQKRVHAIPLSPNSVLRMYRMAPHSPYDPLHLVPKMLNDPSPAALDSRGAFIIHVLSFIYVWVGKNCESVMEKDAKAAAFQVVRYEQVQGPILTAVEGEEPSDFWEAFSSAPPSENGTKINKEQIDSAAKIDVGKRKVESYNVDFELFYKAITGGVVPPFSSPGHGQETHLPARESNWSILRRKFTSGTFCRVYSDSALMRKIDDGIHLLTAEVLTTPPYLSPSSLSYDSSGSYKSSLDSPSISPSTASPSLTPSPASSNLPNTLLPSATPLQLSSTVEPLKPCLESFCSPSKGLARSIAERRGSFSPLKLHTLGKDVSLLDVKNACPETTHEILDMSNLNTDSSNYALFHANNVELRSNIKYLDEQANNISENLVSLRENFLKQDDLLSPGSSVANGIQDNSSSARPLVYRWPDMEKLTTFGREHLDSKAVLLLVSPSTNKTGQADSVLHLWIGGDFEQPNGHAQLKRSRDEQLISIDWHQVGCNFLASIGLPINLPIKVFKEQEKEKLLELLSFI